MNKGLKITGVVLLLILSIPFLILFALGAVSLQVVVVGLAFSLIVFLFLANYDAIEIKYKGVALKTFRAEVDEIKKNALVELEADIDLLRNDLDSHIKKTKSDIEDAIDEAVDTAADETIATLENKIKSL